MTTRQASGPRREHREGYALLAVLWMCAGILLLAGSISAVAREVCAASRNRIGLIRAEWAASGCLNRGRAALVEVLAAGHLPGSVGRSVAWNLADSILEGVGGGDCQLTGSAVGSRLDVNRLDLEGGSRLLQALGLPKTAADSTSAALLDWRDADDRPLPGGAESAWYKENGLAPPANRPFRTLDEVLGVRGMPVIRVALEHLSLLPGSTSINHAPPEVLLSLPGFTPEAARAVAAATVRGQWLTGLADLFRGLSPEAQGSLARALPELVSRATFDPEAWIALARSRAGDPPVEVWVEVRMVRRGATVSVEDKRTWTP